MSNQQPLPVLKPSTPRIYLDTEFTDLQASAHLISLALIDDNGRSFYAEFSDLDLAQCSEWVIEHVICHTRWLSAATPPHPVKQKEETCWEVFGSTLQIVAALKEWLTAYSEIEIWGDCLAYDWVLFCDLFGGAIQLPANIHYIPRDLATLFALRGIDPDISRMEFAHGKNTELLTHNALDDAQLIRSCVNKSL